MGELPFLTPFWLTDGGTFAPNLGFWESGSAAAFCLVLCMSVVQKAAETSDMVSPDLTQFEIFY